MDFFLISLLYCCKDEENFVYNQSKKSAILCQEKYMLKFSPVSAETNNQIQNNFNIIG